MRPAYDRFAILRLGRGHGGRLAEVFREDGGEGRRHVLGHEDGQMCDLADRLEHLEQAPAARRSTNRSPGNPAAASGGMSRSLTRLSEP
jgi:hypothetical protein